MAIRLAVILIAAVLATVVVYKLFTAVVLPSRRRRHIQDLEDENEELDRIINLRNGGRK